MAPAWEQTLACAFSVGVGFVSAFAVKIFITLRDQKTKERCDPGVEAVIIGLVFVLSTIAALCTADYFIGIEGW